MADKEARIEIVVLDPDEIKHDLNSAQVRALLGRGYTVGPWFAVQTTPGEPPKPMLTLIPPSPQAPTVAPVVPQWLLATVVGLWVLVAAGVWVGALWG